MQDRPPFSLMSFFNKDDEIQIRLRADNLFSFLMETTGVGHFLLLTFDTAAILDKFYVTQISMTSCLSTQLKPLKQRVMTGFTKKKDTMLCIYTYWIGCVCVEGENRFNKVPSIHYPTDMDTSKPEVYTMYVYFRMSLSMYSICSKL